MLKNRGVHTPRSEGDAVIELGGLLVFLSNRSLDMVIGKFNERGVSTPRCGSLCKKKEAGQVRSQ